MPHFHGPAWWGWVLEGKLSVVFALLRDFCPLVSQWPRSYCCFRCQISLWGESELVVPSTDLPRLSMARVSGFLLKIPLLCLRLL